jgi:hypothetical protein
MTHTKRRWPRLTVIREEIPAIDGNARLLLALRMILREDPPEEVKKKKPRQLTAWD